MSDMQEFPIPSAEGKAPEQMEPQATLPSHEDFMPQQKVQSLQNELAEMEATMDEQSYPIGEVPQLYQVDPEATLPLNSERLMDFDPIIDEINDLIKNEVTQIQKHQKNIDHWESKIEQNKALIEKNKQIARKNNTEIVYDKKNRDYWYGRSEQVLLDYSNAAVANRADDWAWLIKKYGLKNPDGSCIDSESNCVDELCNGGTNNLAAEYKATGNKYEQAKKDKEAENNRLTRENSKFKGTIEALQKYIQATYENNIEPLQDGVLLLRELGAKLKSLASQEKATYGELRDWAEEFLNEYLKDNSHTSQQVVTDFRRLASIPLPAENS